MYHCRSLALAVDLVQIASHTRHVKILDLIREDLVLPHMRAARRRDVILELGTYLAEQHEGLSPDDVVRVLNEREQLGSTAIDDGVAIPHAKLDTIDRLVACLGRSRKGIDFGALDGKPTHFFFVLLAPENASGDHLKALARICRLFKDADFRSRVMAAKTADEMLEIIAAEDAE